MTGVMSDLGALGLLREATATLETAGVETAAQDAAWLLAAVLGAERFTVYLDPGRACSPAQALQFRELVSRRARREPLQYLTGFEDFHGVRLVVTPDVLIPRPETEGLVAWAIEILRDEPAPVIADVGTGSGAIACALAHGLPQSRVIAIDRSPAALAVASQNVRRLGLSGRVSLMAGDLLEPVATTAAALDLVIANPPYLPRGILSSLPREVADFEPRDALDGGPDGMAVTRRLIAAAPSGLRPGGWLMMEIGDDQAGSLASLMAAEGFTGIRARRDLAGVERYIAGRWAWSAAAPEARHC